jgi:hypothetical protein
MSLYTIRHRLDHVTVPYGPADGFDDISQAIWFAINASRRTTSAHQIAAFEVLDDDRNLVAGFPYPPMNGRLR